MNKNFFILLLSLSILFLVGNCVGQITFQKQISASNISQANSIQQTIDGGYIMAGYIETYQDGAFNDAYLIKTNEEGDTLWTRIFSTMSGAQAYSVQQTTDGGYIITGSTDSVIYAGYVYLIKTNSHGDTLWTKYYGDGDETGFCVRQTNDSGYIIAGAIGNAGVYYDAYLVKTDVNGDLLWTKTYGVSGDNQEANSVRQTSDSGYIICGTISNVHTDSEDVYLIKTNANGDTLWTKTYSGIDGAVGNSIALTIDGGYIITGYTRSMGNDSDYVYLLKTDANGGILWTKTYASTNSNAGYDVQQTSDSGFIVTGSTGPFYALTGDVYLIKTNAIGDTLWTKTYGESNDNEGLSVQQTTDGGYIIGGLTVAPNFLQSTGNIYLIKTDANGNTGCYQSVTNTIIGTTTTQVASSNTIVTSSGELVTGYTVVGSGGIESTLCLTVGINEQTINNTISIYPNPAGNQFTVYGLQFTVSHVEIFNVLGQVCGKSEIVNRESQIEINVSSLSSGIYFVRIADESGSWVGKFVKE